MAVVQYEQGFYSMGSEASLCCRNLVQYEQDYSKLLAKKNFSFDDRKHILGRQLRTSGRYAW